MTRWQAPSAPRHASSENASGKVDGFVGLFWTLWSAVVASHRDGPERPARLLLPIKSTDEWLPCAIPNLNLSALIMERWLLDGINHSRTFLSPYLLSSREVSSLGATHAEEDESNTGHCNG
jgi:hypothetical protein